MKWFILSPVCFLFITACNNNAAQNDGKTNNPPITEKQSFFPVTTYIKGQVFDIRQKGLSPVKYTTQNNHTDSVITKLDGLDTMVKEFLTPVIDSANLTEFYTESKFLDKTIAAFTFTYDAKNNIPDSLPLLHWDVYVEPESGKVKRIYITKKAGADKILQLTWLHNQWFKTTTLLNKPDGTTTVEKEEKVVWDY